MPKEIIFESLLIPDDQDGLTNEQDGPSTDPGLATAQDVRKNEMEGSDGAPRSPAMQPGGSSSTSVRSPSSTFPTAVEEPQSETQKTQNRLLSCNSNVRISTYTELKGWEQCVLHRNAQDTSLCIADGTATSTGGLSTCLPGLNNNQIVASQGETGAATGYAPAMPWGEPEPSHEPQERLYYWLDEDLLKRLASNHTITYKGHGTQMSRQQPTISDAATTAIVRSDGVPSGSALPAAPSSSFQRSEESPSQLEMTMGFYTLSILRSQRHRLWFPEGPDRRHCGYWTTWIPCCNDPLTYEHLMSKHLLPDAWQWYQADFDPNRIPHRADTVLLNAATAKIAAAYLFQCGAEGCYEAFLTRDALSEHCGKRHGDMSMVEKDMAKEGRMLLAILVYIWEGELRDKQRS